MDNEGLGLRCEYVSVCWDGRVFCSGLSLATLLRTPMSESCSASRRISHPRASSICATAAAFCA